MKFKLTKKEVEMEVINRYKHIYHRVLEDLYEFEDPEYWFSEERGGNVAEVRFKHLHTSITESTVSEAECMVVFPNTVIRVCKALFFPLHKRAMPIFVRYMLMHEFRHCWQLKHAKNMFSRYDMMHMFPKLDPKEKDADTFVLTTTRSSYESAVFEYIIEATKGISLKSVLLFYRAMFYILRGE